MIALYSKEEYNEFIKHTEFSIDFLNSIYYNQGFFRESKEDILKTYKTPSKECCMNYIKIENNEYIIDEFAIKKYFDGIK